MVKSLECNQPVASAQERGPGRRAPRRYPRSLRRYKPVAKKQFPPLAHLTFADALLDRNAPVSLIFGIPLVHFQDRHLGARTDLLEETSLREGRPIRLLNQNPRMNRAMDILTVSGGR
jgi:hypothetical protein